MTVLCLDIIKILQNMDSESVDMAEKMLDECDITVDLVIPQLALALLDLAPLEDSRSSVVDMASGGLVLAYFSASRVLLDSIVPLKSKRAKYSQEF